MMRGETELSSTCGPRTRIYALPQENSGILRDTCSAKHDTMLRWALTFLVIALIAALFGFTDLAAGAAAIAKVIFYIFVVLLIVSLLFGGMIWKKTTP